MHEAIWLVLASALCFSGMTWLALAMNVHWTQAMGTPAAATRTPSTLRAAGATALLLALPACLMADRPSMAALVWVMLLTASAVGVAMMLSHRPEWLAPWGGRLRPILWW